MTVKDVCEAAFALMFESAASAPEYMANAPAVLSTLVPELFDINNDLRAGKGLEALAAWWGYTAPEDAVLFEPELCLAALPFGLAAGLFLGDEEEARAMNYSVKYAEAVNACMKLRPHPVLDVYGGDDGRGAGSTGGVNGMGGGAV